MAPRKSKPAVTFVENDRIDGQPHPRETFDLVGQDAALAEAARQIRSGRVPSGWLICGAPGVGKATLAYRIARYLLRYGATDAGPVDLSVPEDDPVAMQVKAAAHPGLMVLKRAVNPQTGKTASVLAVDEVRRLANFFGLSSGAGGWRVVIVDTADDMNDAAANALLKALEEPPDRATLILLSHAPARLLPTIRSRSRRLVLRPLDGTTLEAELMRRLPDISDADRRALVSLSGGSLGESLRLAGSDGLSVATDVEALVTAPAALDTNALVAMSDRLSRMEDGIERFGEALMERLRDDLRLAARAGDAGDAAGVELIERLDRHFRRAGGLHLDPRQTILSAARALRQLPKRQAP
jgi:DNA polymerase-3 subunit delta'